MTETIINISPTPNPNALKFVLNKDVKTLGNSSYKSPLQAQHNPLALKVFGIRGVDQVHFFSNVVTITKFSYEPWETIEGPVMDALRDNIDAHDSHYEDPDPQAERRKALSPELQAIEDILDRTIRPGLQGDGGDMECINYQDNVLLIRYQGACGTCPSSSTGTLEAIKGILRDEYNPELEVYIAPEY